MYTIPNTNWADKILTERFQNTKEQYYVCSKTRGVHKEQLISTLVLLNQLQTKFHLSFLL